MRTYTVNEVFYSIQGEGMRAGTANVFLRFSGCNLTCRAEGEAGFDCDTEFVSGKRVEADGLLHAMRSTLVPGLLEFQREPPWCILTGGEPALQVDGELIEKMHAENWRVAIETNGTVALPPGLDWITVSPKSAEHTIRVAECHEVKYVRHFGQGIPRPRVLAQHKLLSPAFESFAMDDGRVVHRPAPGAIEWCARLVKENPEWRLSAQLHKGWGVR